MVYHLQLNEALGPVMHLAGASIDTKSVDAWVGAGFTTVTGAALFELARRHFRARWDEAQEAIERELRRREAA
jgi:branched-chain amino acid transport system permease protein